jgi:hypothetical protein
VGLFHRKSKWEKLIKPIPLRAPGGAAKSQLTALAALVGISMVSAAVSAVRQRMENL